MYCSINKKNRPKLEYSQYTIALARQLTLKQVATTSIWPYTLEKYEMSRLYGKSKVEQYCALAESSNWSNYLNRNWLLLKRIQYAKRYLIFCHNAMQIMIRKLLLPFSQLVDIKEPSVWFESVLWTPYSPHNESNLPCSCPVWQCCVSICYFQIVLQSANKTGCLRRWWGSPSCSSSAPAPLPQQYKRRPSVMSPPRQIHLPALGEKGEPSAA